MLVLLSEIEPFLIEFFNILSFLYSYLFNIVSRPSRVVNKYTFIALDSISNF